ncbi:hypothetical protein C7R88_04045 [Plesiomonas shigelloides]|nr:hypothetical protein C7R88_04045 [Plesiomonas shigelloides]
MRSVAVIPFLLEAAAVLATFVHPNYIVCLCSWGFTHLPPTCNFKLFGHINPVTTALYMTIINSGLLKLASKVSGHESLVICNHLKPDWIMAADMLM